MTITVGSHGLVEEEVVWKVAAGADAYLAFELIDSGSGNLPTDLTSFSAASQVRNRLGGQVLASMSTETGEITIDGPEGRVEIRLPASQSRGWPARLAAAVFDVELYAPGGGVQRLCTGRLDILPNATVEEGS